MYSNPVYNENMNLAKSLIERKDFKKAYDLLESVADKSSAKWFYLMGITSLNIGYYEQGEEYLKKAVSLSPDNNEYKDAFIRYNNYNDYDRRARSYNRRRRNDLDGCCCCCCDDCCCCCGDDFCEVCTKLWCLDSICECFGGDFIECC
ncbi:hypothetical protein WS9_012350 [Paraclostridium sordellii 8483]|uniref:tetratricopeptide repeat protein n=1 Tax=Paraclostridium sordellii TaxID=1505 RepID=UPI0003190A87|nr:hypothetical protein [Paeniclostridium sordellii]TAN65455.1 hypothetical protein WS9_012350 [Paeniclostridium sordellii 8483]